MAKGCCGGSSGETLIFTCAGAAHSGQVANRAGVRLMQEYAGKLFCITAVAAEIPGKLKRARDAGARVAIDGCENACCRLVMERAGFPIDVYVLVTDMGIEKQPQTADLIADSKRVVERVQEAIAKGG